MATHSSSLLTLSCTASGAKGIHGHFGNNPFPDYLTAERTWTDMLEVQLEYFKKTPLLTNTQPDYSRVGNSELLDRTVRSNNWIRSDTIFIENEQIEALSNRPPWIAALLEQGLPGKPPDPSADA